MAFSQGGRDSIFPTPLRIINCCIVARGSATPKFSYLHDPKWVATHSLRSTGLKDKHVCEYKKS